MEDRRISPSLHQQLKEKNNLKKKFTEVELILHLQPLAPPCYMPTSRTEENTENPMPLSSKVVNQDN